MKNIFLLLLLSMASLVVAETQYSSQNGQFDAKQYQRDPFTTSDKMHGQADLKPNERDGYGGFIPGYGSGGQGIPQMRLRGFLTKNVSNATALLEIGGQVFMVSKGDEIGLHAIGAKGVLKVIDVGPNGVKVQAGRVNQVIIIR